MIDKTAMTKRPLLNSSDGIDGAGQDWGEGDDFISGDIGRFSGDEGTWAPAFRDAMVHLYKRRFISKAQHPQHWEPLVQNLPLVRADLNNHNLALVLDTTREVMFKKQAPVRNLSRPLRRVLRFSSVRRCRSWAC